MPDDTDTIARELAEQMFAAYLADDIDAIAKPLFGVETAIIAKALCLYAAACAKHEGRTED